MTTAMTGPPAAPQPPATASAVTPAAPILAPLEFGKRGMQLSTYDELWRFSNMISRTDFAPKDMRSKPEAIMAAIQLGAELGLGPIQAMQNIAVINGRPSVWGDSMLALCQAFPKFNHEVFREWYTGTPYDDDFTAHCQVGRLGVRTPIVASFSVADAKKAGLWGKAGTWTNYPKRMLQMRARSFGLRNGFADVLKGIWTREEMMDVERSAEMAPDVMQTASQIEASLTTGPPTMQLPEMEVVEPPEPVQAEPVPEKKGRGRPPKSDTELKMVRMAILNGFARLTELQRAAFLKNCSLEKIGDIEGYESLDDLRSIQDAIRSA